MTTPRITRHISLAGLCLVIFGFCLCCRASASGLTITHARLDAGDFRRISFTVSWEHAWNLDATSAPGNHDAAWIFVKYRSGRLWKHLELSSTAIHQSADPGQVRVEPVPDGKGVFLLPGFSGGGDVGATSITLELAHPLPPAQQYEFLIAGVEMVYVPEAAYYLGDDSSHNSFGAGDGSGPFWVENEREIRFGMNADELAADSMSASAVAIPADWPKGFGGFYCMKYEISQEQYADFLYTLDPVQQAARIAVSPQSSPGALALSSSLPFRNGIRIRFPANDFGSSAEFGHDLQPNSLYNEANDGQGRACNWLSWDDLCAYLDWACLRPLTEMEFEKASRGPLPPLLLEFAWGTDEIVDANTLLFDGTAEETVSETLSGNEGLGSHGYLGPQGPLRCGFAAGPGTNRREAGAGYYGIMELSGNLWEQCVIARPAGLGFTGQNGDGSIGSDGFANETDWPDAAGAGHRGGGWNSGILPGFRDLAVSDRFYAGLAPVNRRNTTGGRGGRSNGQ